MQHHHLSKHLVEPLLGVVTIVGGINANAVAAWGAVAVYLVFLWNDKRRESLRRAADDQRAKRALDEIDRVNRAAIRAGRPVPHPEYLPPRAGPGEPQPQPQPQPQNSDRTGAPARRP